MLQYIFFLFFFIIRTFAFEKQCNSCKFFIPHLSKNPELGLCKFFKHTPYKDKSIIIYNPVSKCRNDENFCGKDGIYYQINEDLDNQDLISRYEDLNNSCSGEVNEKSDIEELEKLEKEFFDIYQKIRKHNTKIVYNTAKNIYKSIKKNK